MWLLTIAEKFLERLTEFEKTIFMSSSAVENQSMIRQVKRHRGVRKARGFLDLSVYECWQHSSLSSSSLPPFPPLPPEIRAGLKLPFLKCLGSCHFLILVLFWRSFLAHLLERTQARSTETWIIIDHIVRAHEIPRV